MSEPSPSKPTMYGRKCRFNGSAALFIFFASCGPRIVAPAVSGFPPQHAGRQRWVVRDAVIYASKPGDAADADRWLRAADQRLRREAGEDVSFGMIVVTNTTDTPLGLDAEMRWRGFQYMSDICHGTNQGSAPSRPPELDAMPCRLMRTMPFPLAPGDRTGVIPLSAVARDRVKWVVVLPSLDCVDTLLDEMMRHAPPMMKLLRPLIRPGLRANLAKKSELAIYTAVVGAEEAWSSDRRQRLVLDAIAAAFDESQAEAYRTDGPGVIRW